MKGVRIAAQNRYNLNKNLPPNKQYKSIQNSYIISIDMKSIGISISNFEYGNKCEIEWTWNEMKNRTVSMLTYWCVEKRQNRNLLPTFRKESPTQNGTEWITPTHLKFDFDGCIPSPITSHILVQWKHTENKRKKTWNENRNFIEMWSMDFFVCISSLTHHMFNE